VGTDIPAPENNRLSSWKFLSGRLCLFFPNTPLALDEQLEGKVKERKTKRNRDAKEMV